MIKEVCHATDPNWSLCPPGLRAPLTAGAQTFPLSDFLAGGTISVGGVEFSGFQHRGFAGQFPPTPGIHGFGFDIFQNRGITQLPPPIPPSLLTVRGVFELGQPGLALSPFVNQPGTSSLTQVSYLARSRGVFANTELTATTDPFVTTTLSIFAALEIGAPRS